MIILDSLLIGGIKFVLDKVASAVDEEMNDETSLREELLAAQMRVELGEMDEADFVDLERAILARLREIRDAKHANLKLKYTGPWPPYNFVDIRLKHEPITATTDKR